MADHTLNRAGFTIVHDTIFSGFQSPDGIGNPFTYVDLADRFAFEPNESQTSGDFAQELLEK